MKCDLVLHDVDYIVLPNIQILATLLDSAGQVEEGGEALPIEEMSMSEALLFALDMAREYYQIVPCFIDNYDSGLNRAD